MNRFHIALGKPPEPIPECPEIPPTLMKYVQELYRRGSDPMEGIQSDFKGWGALKEIDAVTRAHHGLGAGIRNEWKLWYNKDDPNEKLSELAAFFRDLGIWHADDMSSIILTTLHRLVNNRPIDLDGQVQKYIDYWINEKNNPDANTFVIDIEARSLNPYQGMSHGVEPSPNYLDRDLEENR